MDVRAEAAAALAGQHGAEPTTSLEQALARPNVDAVAVCTPSGLHADVAVQALRAGKHVVVEKPVDVVDPAAGAAGRGPAGCGDQGHGDQSAPLRPGQPGGARDGHRRPPGKITSGLASIALWRSQEYYDSGEWRGTWALDGGGALMNQGVHQIDLLVWMPGRPVAVSATTARLAHEGIEVEDTAVATIRFDGGALAVVHGTTAAYPGISNGVQVQGSQGSAVIDDDRLAYFHAAPPRQRAPDYGAGTSSDQAREVLPDGGDPGTPVDAHARQYADFLGAVEESREPLVTVAEAARTLAVITSIYRSARADRPVPVRLPTA